MFMGILNAIFAPFIVLYLIMYSFFRYFDVRIPTSTSHFVPITYRTFAYHRNITRTHPPSAVGSTLLSQNGSSGSSMNYPTISPGDLMNRTQPLPCISDSFRTRS